jgi:hypothetical protein
MPTPANALNIGTAGLQSFDGTATFNGRTITGTANQIVVTNGDGVSGNPTLALATNIQVTGISFNSGTDILSAFTNATSFSPTITGSGASGSVGYTTRQGRYMRMGPIVIYSFTLVGTITGSPSGDFRVSLPVTAVSGVNNYGAGVFSDTTNMAGAWVAAGGAAFVAYTLYTTLANAQITAFGYNVQGTISYFVA